MKSPTLAAWVGDVDTFASGQWQHMPAREARLAATT
jgi:hypothetical protein